MRKISCGTSGSDKVQKVHKLSEISMPEELISAFLTYYGSDITLRPAQDAALFLHSLLDDNNNAIIATPTNSGKSLLAYLLLFKAAIAGQNVVLIEPLRALAYEKSEELKRIAGILKSQSNKKVKVTITTGDYRLNDEHMFSKPQRSDIKELSGQIIIATPERLDAISRVKENIDWFNSLSLVCLDEAHLIGDTNRGAAIELLIAFLRSLRRTPRLVLMSATISNADKLAEWLNPCTVIDSIERYPKLSKWVFCVDQDEEVNDILIDEVIEILKAPTTSVVIFVYQTTSAENLACLIAERLTGRKIKAHDLSDAMSSGVAWFHANLSIGTKESIIKAMTLSKVRVTVSTTALSMGINLPATHVFVRDITFSGHKDLDVADLLQMLGRAGRGNTEGKGSVMLSKSNLSKENIIVRGLTEEALPNVVSRLVSVEDQNYYGTRSSDWFFVDRFGNQLMGIINRYGNITRTSLQSYFNNSLGGAQIKNVQEVLDSIVRWKLAFLNEDTNEYELTHLGKVASSCYMPPITAANAGQLIRDLLLDEPSGLHILCLAPIDYIIMLCLISAETRPIARYSKGLESKITEYMEGLPLQEKSYLYRTWISSAPDSLLGSANVIASSSDAKKQVLQNTFTAMLIYDLSRGTSLEQLKKFYPIDVEEIQEKLRDNTLWLLCGLEKILEVRSFYFHLKTNCEVEYDQIRSVETAFKKASKSIFEVVGNLKYRSRLGELIRSIKHVYPHAKSYPGEGTIRTLELASILSIKDLVGKTSNDLVDIGVNRAYADLIVGYVQKRRS